nr:unnamed protein product [Spirometra erinaceieuropaei]
MLRGSIIVFVGILSTVFLRRRLWGFHWTGMMVTVFGLCLVGVASVFKPSTESLITSPAKAALGLLLVLLGSLATASQMIVEEVFLKKHGFHALHVVGMEGFFGMFVMGFIILPIIHHIPGHDLNGSYENQLDALYQTFQDPVLLSTTILLILSIAFFNYFGLAVTGCLSVPDLNPDLSPEGDRGLTTAVITSDLASLDGAAYAVHRTLLDALRSVFVWCTSLFLFYATFQDPVLLSTTILLILSIAFFNYFGLAVTGCLSAVHRTLLDALRSVFVWCTSLFLFYAVSHRFGEPFDPAWGLIEIDGFCMLVMGTLIFNKILRLDWIPCCAESAPAIPDESVEVPADSTADDSSERKPLLAGDASGNAGTFGSVDDQTNSVQA